MENSVADPSSLGEAMLGVIEARAAGPEDPELPQLPQVSQASLCSRSGRTSTGWFCPAVFAFIGVLLHPVNNQNKERTRTATTRNERSKGPPSSKLSCHLMCSGWNWLHSGGGKGRSETIAVGRRA